MDSKDLYKELEKDNAAQIILALSKLYNQLRQQPTWMHSSLF